MPRPSASSPIETPTVEGHTARAEQQPDWPDDGLLWNVREALSRRPPLTTEEETAQLAEALTTVGRHDALVLQGGDCAEVFDDASDRLTRHKLGQLYGLAETMRVSVGLPVVTLGRIAGQYAKPRSSPTERLPNGVILTSYRGDAVNDATADPLRRAPNPRRLLRAYDAARAILDVVRQSWTGRRVEERLFVSHELLLLDYELPLVREGRSGRYAGSTHFGWIGDRTRTLHGAHIALAAAVRNPTAVKLGPTTSPEVAVALSDLLNPEGRPGQPTFIVRMGVERIERILPAIVSAVARRGHPVAWMCDPMHGNTVRTADGRKTRSVPAIDREVAAFVRILRAHRQWPGGLHLEMTPQDVTECVSAPPETVADAALPRYHSACDPRLNPGQAADVVSRFAALL